VIRERAVARRYAVALFGAAQKAGVAEAVLADLASIDALEKHGQENEGLHGQGSTLQRFLEAPDVLTEHKVETLRVILGGRVHPLVLRLCELMLAKKRIAHLPPVYEEYRDLVEESLGIARAHVTTAVLLDAAVTAELTKRLEAVTGKTVRLDLKVDPAILGGVVAVVGGKIVDGSLRHRLAELREQLLGARVH
jgi:F-type H+-transporting ATPase subunit delta